MQHSAYDRVDFIAIVIGAIVAGVFFLTSGVMSGASALAGCMLGVLNFAALRFILSRLLSRMDDTKNAASMSALFLVKLIGLVAVLYRDSDADREETSDREDTATPVLDGIARAREAAAGAVRAAENGDDAAADDRLSASVESLRGVRDELATDAQAGYSDEAVEAIDPKTLAAIERARDAISQGRPD